MINHRQPDGSAPGPIAEVKVYACNGGYLKTQTQYILKDTRIGAPMDIPIPFLLLRQKSLQPQRSRKTVTPRTG